MRRDRIRLVERHAARVRPVTVTTLQCVAGLIPLAAAGLLIRGQPAEVTLDCRRGRGAAISP